MPAFVSQTQVANFCQQHHITEFALFGSVLRDDFTPTSDIDVLIDFAPGARRGFFALSALREELTRLLGRPVDLVTKGGLSPFLKDEILATRQVIYAQKG